MMQVTSVYHLAERDEYVNFRQHQMSFQVIRAKSPRWQLCATV